MSDDSRESFLPTRHSLLSRLRQWDDRASWNEFCRTYEPLIRSVARKAGVRQEDVADVAQETLLSVAREMADFRYDPGKGSFKGWLRLIARRRIADHLRKVYSRPILSGETPSGGPASPGEAAADPESVLDRIWDDEWKTHLMSTAMERVKEKVSAKQFQIFDQTVLQGVPPAEAARALGVTLVNLYVSRHRVARALKKEMARIEAEA